MLHRCPKCLHPMAPGQGVPDTRLGAFGRGIGTDCNECGFQVPEGARMLWGASGSGDDPMRSLAGRIAGTFPIIIPLGGTAVLTAMLGAWAMRGTGLFAGTPMIPVAVACLFGVLFLLVAMARLLRPALRDLRSGFSANRSTWLVGHGSFEEWKHGGSGAAESRAVGPVLAVSVRVHSLGDTLRVTALAADASQLGPGAKPEALPEQLRRMQLPRVVLAGKPVVVMVGKTPTVQPQAVPPVTMLMHVPRGEPGFESAEAAARTVARTCLGTVPTRIPADDERLDGTSWTPPNWLHRLGAALGGPAPRGTAGTSAERWESDRNGLIAVSSTPDGLMSTALAIPAWTLRLLGPRVETTDHGTGESTVVLVSGDKQVRGMTVPRRGDEVSRAAAQVIANATA